MAKKIGRLFLNCRSAQMKFLGDGQFVIIGDFDLRKEEVTGTEREQCLRIDLETAQSQGDFEWTDNIADRLIDLYLEGATDESISELEEVF